MVTAIATVFVFLMVILFHEFGHFIVAKLVGIKVNEFSIGMGPKLLQKKGLETVYTLRLLPIGGYCSMEGEDEESNDPRGFNNASAWSRIAVVAAGAVMNFILAILVLSIVSYNVGTATTTVLEIQENSPAEIAGIKSGDVILSINGREINDWNSIVDEISDVNPQTNLMVKVSRNGEIIEFNLKPIINEEENRAIIGISPVLEKSLSSAIVGGFETTGTFIKALLDFVKSIFTGGISAKDLSGPVGIIYTIGEAAKYGINNVLLLMGYISVNLGVLNLLPVPALDGSRIVFLLIEIIRGKPINPEKEGFVHFVGIVLLMVLMVFVTYTDITRFDIFGR